MRHTIKKGKHDAKELAFGIHTGTRSEVWEVEFNNTNLYEPLDQEHDWNKLCGWSYGMHHKNSIRAGWRSAGEKIELCLYLYENGERYTSSKTIIIPTDFKATIELHCNNGQASMKVWGYTWPSWEWEVTLPYSAKPTWGYFLFPYFGGNAPAPHEMFINLKRL